ncbi:hypothetical protein BpHYR1_021585 [Brachionus plicatilis]|uniref:Uncharacterized protein n=1 Tax=Brachionus plicatilis TaxID=10195 RepID=A0A3M7SUA6_BRAPC|nr:hypothetical protein BpHYR1_021585 [Brachionus plicatilis]
MQENFVLYSLTNHLIIIGFGKNGFFKDKLSNISINEKSLKEFDIRQNILYSGLIEWCFEYNNSALTNSIKYYFYLIEF